MQIKAPILDEYASEMLAKWLTESIEEDNQIVRSSAQRR